MRPARRRAKLLGEKAAVAVTDSSYGIELDSKARTARLNSCGAAEPSYLNTEHPSANRE